MHARSSSTVLFVYLGVVATAVAVIALGAVSILQASTGLSSAGTREKTVLELQVENSREIRRALAVPVVTPPLPPITARPARAIAAIPLEKRPAQVKLSREALNAMAMDRSDAQPSVQHSYSTPNRHTQY